VEYVGVEYVGVEYVGVEYQASRGGTLPDGWVGAVGDGLSGCAWVGLEYPGQPLRDVSCSTSWSPR
jgi:hypothetical protein